jgi:outer membrane protein OmpA-like peptidoglycan-associated protein
VRGTTVSRTSYNRAAAFLTLQCAAGNAAVAKHLAARRPVVQRCGPTPCDCSAEERAEYATEHGEPSEDEAPVQTSPLVQRATEGSEISELPAELRQDVAEPEEQVSGGGQVADSNRTAAVQRHQGPIVVQRISRRDEIDLSLSSPGRAVLDATGPSLSLYNFGIDRPEPKAFHRALLTQFSEFLQREVTAPTRIRVVGHADPTGTSPHNQTLSANRAASVASVLLAQGSPTETFAEGDSHPVASNASVDGRSRNRRVDILVSATGPPQPEDPSRPRRDQRDRDFCERYQLLCTVSPPGIPIPPWPLLCILVPELCLAIPCMINPAMCVPPPPPRPPDRPQQPDGSPTVIFGPVRAANTPAGMGDRIPDQGATPVPVLVSGLDTGASPITIRVDGSPGPNGDVGINGAATAQIAGSTLLAVSGLAPTQTSAHGFHLRLEATHGGSVVGRSRPFAVSAIMFDMGTSTAGVISDPTGLTLEALMTKQSDGSAGIGSLNEMEYGEHLRLVEETGGMRGMGLGDHGFLALANINQIDNHGTEMRHMLLRGTQTIQQTHSFVDHRTDSREIPVTNSGFSVVREVAADPDRPGCLVFTVIKTGAPGSADGVPSDAGSGTASARAPVPCPPGPNHPGPATDPANRTIPIPFTGPIPSGSTPIFYQGGVTSTAAEGSFVDLTFSFRIRGERFFSTIPCSVVANTATGVELETLNPMPVNVAPLGSEPIVIPARKRMTVPRDLL